eukprot:TRINITY_DN63246_c0_g2_i1.p1 TRINITY_DN63246_c0_g2~~TRINITY_DN63246_c0_g2_i1.p1  ORF type:complete len:130 (+),score=31.90 TRINITY_DN63246_c0_g2_i1:29-418(+)
MMKALFLVVAFLAFVAYCDDFDKMVKIDTQKEGDGKTFPKAGQKVKCHYILTVNGNKVDSSRDRGQPFEFTIGKGQVIKGWDQGLLKLSVGQRAILTIQPEWGYGKSGAGGQIPPNAVLTFDVELLGVK